MKSLLRAISGFLIIVPTALYAAPKEATSIVIVFFSSGKHELHSDYVLDVQRARECVEAWPGAKVDIIAFSDGLGSQSDNDALSKKRAQTLSTMIQKAGVAKDRMGKIEGRGEINGESEKGSALNRRGEMHISGETPPQGVMVACSVR